MFFQELVHKLNEFWGSHGVLIGQPYGVEVAAGTANPLTIFRVLGPEPFNVAYVEPSRRPADGMYGKNPNRFQHYYQYQIILKPAPRFNIQLYIDMLRHIGIEPTKHDIRFVEDNWSSPSLSAFGTGWEVWLDGMEITQYTYFQQVAGVRLDPPALEITLGLERIAMYIQDIKHYKDLKWNQDITYADLFQQHEYWQSRYNFDEADIQTTQALYDLHYQEAKHLLRLGNYWAAYDHLLKMSHLFNILDARGVITYNQRIAHFKEMADLMKQVAKLYLDERKSLNYPLLNIKPIKYTPSIYDAQEILDQNKDFKDEQRETDTLGKEATLEDNYFVFELGFEPLPADYLTKLYSAINQEAITSELKAHGFTVSDIQIILTPIRVGVIITGAPLVVERPKRVYGPYYNQAFVGSIPSKALLGFAKKHGVNINEISWQATPQGKRAYIEKTTSTHLPLVVAQVFEDIFKSVPFKEMYWGQKGVTAVRPLRWVLALHNNQKVDLNFWGIRSENITQLPLFIENGYIKIESAGDYINLIRKAGIIIDPRTRYEMIKQNLPKKIDSSTELLWEDTMLTESPIVVERRLPNEYYELPFEVVQAILEKNQRFILANTDTGVKYFMVLNRAQDDAQSLIDKIADGYFKVVKARLDDGVAYVQRDLRIRFEDYRERLKQIPFSPNSKSLWHHTQRIASTVRELFTQYPDILVNYNRKLIDKLLPLIRNARATILGHEYPDIEYAIAGFYTQKQGYAKYIYSTLKEMNVWIPREQHAHLLATLETLDSLVVLAQETDLSRIGSKDPYQLKRLAHRLIDLLTQKYPISLLPLPELIEVTLKTARLQGLNLKYDNQQIYSFIVSRAVAINKYKLPLELVRGVYFGRSTILLIKHIVAETLQQLQDVEGILKVFKRVHNILRKSNRGKKSNIVVNSKLFKEKSEVELYNYIRVLQDQWEHITDLKTAESLGNTLIKQVTKLGELLETLFNEVLINTTDKPIRDNRLALLQIVKHTLDTFIDLEQVWGNK